MTTWTNLCPLSSWQRVYDAFTSIALGHDIGHTPLGHFGESVLNDISKRELGEYFAHNIL